MATTVTTPVLVTILATVAGVIIVGVSGGLIRPMQQRCKGPLSTAEREVPRMKAHADAAPSVLDQASSAAPDPSGSSSTTGSTAVYDQTTDGSDASSRQY